MSPPAKALRSDELISYPGIFFHIHTDSWTAVGAPSGSERQNPPAAGASQPPSYTPPSHADVNGFHGITRSASHSRDPPGTRGRVLSPSSVKSSVLQAQHSGPALSPRSQSSNRSPAGLSVTMERRPSLTQNHYRNAPKAHGLFAHSRNTSFVNSPATSPLSPFVPNGPMAVHEFPSLAMHQSGSKDPRPSDSSSNISNLSSASTLTTNQEGGDTSSSGQTMRRLDRSGGNSTRRGHSHHRSQTKHQHAIKPQTVTEWTIYHLFVSVSQPTLNQGRC